MFHRRLPRMRKIGINTTGLTPAPRDPDAHPHREVLRRQGPARQHPRVARRHRRHPRPGPARQAGVRQGVPDDRGDAGARPSEYPNFQFGIASTIFGSNLEDAENILAWARTKKLDIVFNMLRFTDAMLNNKELQETIGFHEREEQFMRKFFLDRVQEESVLSGQAFLYLHYADMIANGYQRTMPCPVPDAGAAAESVRRPALLRELEGDRQRPRDARRRAVFRGRQPRASRGGQEQRLPHLPEPLPGERRRDEAVRAVREVPRPGVPGEARPRPPPRDAADAAALNAIRITKSINTDTTGATGAAKRRSRRSNARTQALAACEPLAFVRPTVSSSGRLRRPRRSHHGHGTVKKEMV